MNTISDAVPEIFHIQFLDLLLLEVRAVFSHSLLTRLELSIADPATQPIVNHPLGRRLLEILKGKGVSLDSRVYRLTGTPFQLKVWQETARIPHGATITYGELAETLGCASPRAVGQALKRNPLPIVVPCHRVIGRSGNLTGFSCGLDVKKALLDIEKACTG